MRRFFFACLVVCELTFCCALSAVAAEPKGSEENPYTVGIVPQFEAQHLFGIWQPILRAITERSGLHFAIKGTPSIPSFERNLAEGVFDFAYMNPYHLLVANRKQGVLPLVRDVGRDLFGVLVVRKDSDIEQIEALDGKPVAFPAPNALGASLLMRAELQELHGIKVLPRYVRSHSSVYLNVALGETMAGGGVQKTLLEQGPALRDSLRIIYSTRKVASHPFAVHPRVSKEDREKVRQAMLELARSDEGKRLYARIPISELGAATVEDYRPLTELGLERYYVEE